MLVVRAFLPPSSKLLREGLVAGLLPVRGERVELAPQRGGRGRGRRRGRGHGRRGGLPSRVLSRADADRRNGIASTTITKIAIKEQNPGFDSQKFDSQHGMIDNPSGSVAESSTIVIADFSNTSIPVHQDIHLESFVFAALNQCTT